VRGSSCMSCLGPRWNRASAPGRASPRRPVIGTRAASPASQVSEIGF